jgi:hypothetical protein
VLISVECARGAVVVAQRRRSRFSRSRVTARSRRDRPIARLGADLQTGVRETALHHRCVRAGLRCVARALDTREPSRSPSRIRSKPTTLNRHRRLVSLCDFLRLFRAARSGTSCPRVDNATRPTAERVQCAQRIPAPACSVRCLRPHGVRTHHPHPVAHLSVHSAGVQSATRRRDAEGNAGQPEGAAKGPETSCAAGRAGQADESRRQVSVTVSVVVAVRFIDVTLSGRGWESALPRPAGPPRVHRVEPPSPCCGCHMTSRIEAE